MIKVILAVTLALSAAALAGCSSKKGESDAETTTEAVTKEKSYAFRLTDKGTEISRNDGEVIQEIEFYSPWLKEAYAKDPDGNYFETADFDFDGDDDVAVLVSAEDNVETYQYFRYDKEKNTFEGWEELDIMYSLAAVDENAKTLSFHSPNGEEGYYDTVYRWTDDEKLMPVSAVIQYSDENEAVRYSYEYDENGVSTCIKKERVLRDENGKLTDKTEELPIETDDE